MQVQQLENKRPKIRCDFLQHATITSTILAKYENRNVDFRLQRILFSLIRVVYDQLRLTRPASIPLQIPHWGLIFKPVKLFIYALFAFFTALVGSSHAAIEVVCTTGMVADLVRQVGADRVRVTTLISDGVDPHLYKPTRDDVARLLKADMIFYSGLHLEGRMEATFQKMRQQGKPVTPVTSSIPVEKLLTQGNAADPHVWMDPLIWAECMHSVVATLVKADPDGRGLFDENAARYRASLTAVSEWIRHAIATIPAEKRILITAHDAFQYYGRATGLEVMGLQGLSTESEAGVADINRVVDEIVKRQVPAVFFESTLSEKNVRAVIEGAASRGQTVKLGGMLYSDSLGSAGTPEATCEGMLKHNTRTITQALSGNTP